MPRSLPDWLAAYMEWTENQESPEAFHLWTGMVVLATALHRQVYLDRVWYKLYPNIYVLIVAESAMARKSVAMNMGLGVLREALPDVYIIGDRVTPEGLVRFANRSTTGLDAGGRRVHGQDSSLLIYADELANLFGYDKAMASRLAILLTRVYESQERYTHTTSTEGRRELFNLYWNVLAATAPHNLKVMPEEAIGGLLGRLILVSAKGRKKTIAWGIKDPMSDELRGKLVADLFRISQLEGQFTVTKEAADYFTTWYEKQSDITYEDAAMDAFHARCHDTALKLACLLSVSRGDDLVVSIGHMAAGITYVEKQLPEFSRVSSWAGGSDFSRARAKFLDLLRRNGGYVSKRLLLRGMGMPMADFDMLVATLEQDGSVQVQKAGKEFVVRLVADP